MKTDKDNAATRERNLEKFCEELRRKIEETKRRQTERRNLEERRRELEKGCEDLQDLQSELTIEQRRAARQVLQAGFERLENYQREVDRLELQEMQAALQAVEAAQAGNPAKTGSTSQKRVEPAQDFSRAVAWLEGLRRLYYSQKSDKEKAQFVEGFFAGVFEGAAQNRLERAQGFFDACKGAFLQNEPASRLQERFENMQKGTGKEI